MKRPLTRALFCCWVLADDLTAVTVAAWRWLTNDPIEYAQQVVDTWGRD